MSNCGKNVSPVRAVQVNGKWVPDRIYRMGLEDEEKSLNNTKKE